MACSTPGSSPHGISQARILEWVAISFSRGFLLDCRCQACSEDREVPVTAQGQCLSSWPPSYSCGDFRRWRWFAENRYSRKQRRNLLVVIYDSSLPSSWGWRVDSEAIEWPPQQVGRWESGGLTQRRCPINWQRYPGSNGALLGSQITVWMYSNTLSYSQAWYLF